MLLRTFAYDACFRCLAEQCPRSCCTGWEVAVDERTAAYYKTVPGPLGDRLRAALRGPRGERQLALENGRCPFLEDSRLCEIHRVLGQAHTGDTCRAHPRFTEDYGAVRETLLSASCPAAAALLTGESAPLRLTQRRVGENAPWSDPWLPALWICRERAAALLQDRRRPLRQRLAWLVLFGNEVQLALDEEETDSLPALCGAWAALPTGAPALELDGAEALWPALWDTLKSMEVLETDWLPLLNRAEEETGGAPLPEAVGERIACYFLARYFLRAVNDGDLLSRVQLTVFSTLAVERLAALTASMAEALYRYCREIEHSRPNLERLQKAFCTRPGLGLASFLRELEHPEGT